MISVQKCFAATNRVLVWNCLLPLKDQEHKMKWNMDTFWCRYIPVHTFGFYHCVFHEMYIGTVVMNHTAKNDRWFKTNWKPEKQLCSVPLTTLHRAFFHLSLWLNSHMFDHLVLFKPEKTIAPETLHSNENRRSTSPLQCCIWTSFVHVLPLGFHHWHIICNWFVVIEHRKQSQIYLTQCVFAVPIMNAARSAFTSISCSVCWCLDSIAFTTTTNTQ